MKSYVFENPGVIDPRSITTFGVSSKENETAIGFFGTGLKYAIAVLLRLGCEVSIVSGSKLYTFGVQRDKVRVNTFDFVTMNGVPLGFTTELGKTWEMWQAFRELACNALDERGMWYETEDPDPKLADPDKTYVIVRGAPFSVAWAERDSIVLPFTTGMLAVTSDEHMTAYAGQSNYIYYRGVRVMKLRKPSLYTYDIKDKVTLTEDRTIMFPWIVDYMAQNLTGVSKNIPFLKAVLVAGAENWEGSALTFSSANTIGPEFAEVVMDYARVFHPMLNPSARKLVTDNNIADFVKDEAIDLDSVDKERLRRANDFLLRMGYSVTDYPIVITTHLGNDVLGRAHNETIYISKRCLMMGTKMLAGTILEEDIHLKHGLVDETRGMQNFLFDALISAGERITGMPL